MEKPMGNHWGTTDFGILVQAKAVAQWVRRVVVRHGLCPWAEEALRWVCHWFCHGLLVPVYEVASFFGS